MAQLVTRVDDRLAAAVDELVAAGIVASRSEAVRLGLERLIDRCRRIRRSFLTQRVGELQPEEADEICRALRALADC